MSLAPAYGVSGALIADGSLLRRDFADPAGVAVRRRGACARGDGIVRYSIVYDGAPYTIRGKALYLGSGLQTLWGRRAPGYFELRVTANGELELNANGTNRGRSDYGEVPQDGTPFSWELRVATTGLQGWINGVKVVESLVAETLNVATPTTWIGAAYNLDPSAWRGALWDIEHESTLTANTAYFPLDARTASGDYPNQHPGSLVGDATVSGTVLPVLVNAAGGDGVPVYTRPVVVCLRRDSVQTFTGANGNLLYDNLALDPYGWGDDVTAIEVPVNNSTSLALTGRMRAKALSGSDEVEIQMNESGVGQIARQALTMGTVDKWVPFSLIAAVGDKPAGTRYAVFVAGVAATSTIEIDDVYLTAIITPSTTV